MQFVFEEGFVGGGNTCLTIITLGVTIMSCDQDVQVLRYPGSFQGEAGRAIREYLCCRTTQAAAVGDRGTIGRSASAPGESVGSLER